MPGPRGLWRPAAYLRRGGRADGRPAVGSSRPKKIMSCRHKSPGRERKNRAGHACTLGHLAGQLLTREARPRDEARPKDDLRAGDHYWFGWLHVDAGERSVHANKPKKPTSAAFDVGFRKILASENAKINNFKHIMYDVKTQQKTLLKMLEMLSNFLFNEKSWKRTVVNIIKKPFNGNGAERAWQRAKSRMNSAASGLHRSPSSSARTTRQRGARTSPG